MCDLKLILNQHQNSHGDNSWENKKERLLFMEEKKVSLCKSLIFMTVLWWYGIFLFLINILELCVYLLKTNIYI